MDGLFDDWEVLDPLYEDAIGDQAAGDLDLGDLWVANDENYFFLSFEVGCHILLQETNDLRLYLDTDNDPSTGTPVCGIGAELYWTFGDRNGRYYVGIYSYSIHAGDLLIVPAPSTTSDRFEIAIPRDVVPYGSNLLFSGDTLAIVIRDLGEGQDQLPEQGETVRYVFDDSPLPPLEPLTLLRQDSTHLRILSYNVHMDDFFESWAEEEYTRILNAIDPDIIGFQEIYDHNDFETVDRVEEMLGGTWYGDKIGADIVLVSRYPFLDTEYVDGNGAYLINLEADYNCQMLLINCHLPAGQANFERQMEVDAIMAFIRDTKAGTTSMTLAEDTPILIMGDMNFVGYATQLETFLTGNIVYQGQHGQAFDPDWDGTDFTDLLPRQVVGPMYHTWISSPYNNCFCPGRLDFMIFSDSVMEPGTNFVLYTPAMSPDSLAAYGLQADDTEIASDHLPVVGDFWLHLGSGIRSEILPEMPEQFVLHQNFPNPFNAGTVISYQLSVFGYVNLSVYDISGAKVAELVDGWQKAGGYQVDFDPIGAGGSGMAAGIYLYRLQAEGFIGLGKMVLLK
jgi:endonuclease/exonuclease/phosphatase family metal-dependent hydrolase